MRRSRFLTVSFVTLAAVVLAFTAAACAHQTAAPAEQLLAVGTPAPEFVVTAHDGQVVDLAKLRGRWVVLYFYPKDDTLGCTKEACEFRDAWTRLQSAGVVVLGVSTQDAASHVAFASKYHLPFPLLPDERGALAAKYHVPLAGGLAQRVTYLIDRAGLVSRVWPKVSPAGHAAEVLEQIKR
jgi:peroxiredoxin Q/BCP